MQSIKITLAFSSQDGRSALLNQEMVLTPHYHFYITMDKDFFERWFLKNINKEEFENGEAVVEVGIESTSIVFEALVQKRYEKEDYVVLEILPAPKEVEAVINVLKK